ncbi:glutathione S-transferase family protein [Terricaulis sp.]|uniref:glutathione S-transferase family protein n=1 Tax=Terricaulis sp. TaxID=2768686 RepID=UPI0037834297
MAITITAFANSLDQGRGLARDMIVRWALEEAGQPYRERLIPWADFKKPAHRQRNPFGQIPTYEEGDLILFESGAIVLHVAERFKGLFPVDANARARAIMWMFAAVSDVEPVIVQMEVSEYMESDKSWNAERAPLVADRARGRLADLAARLGGAAWLDGDFSAADVLMVQALRRLEGQAPLTEFPSLVAYVERGKARPAFKRAFAAQRAAYEATKAAS